MTTVELTCEKFQAEKILPLATIREHTNTDDVEHFSDNLLKLYRAAAIEACELYTGQLLKGQKTITEAVKPPRRNRAGRHFGMAENYNFATGGFDAPATTAHVHRTRYAFAQERAYLFGGGLTLPLSVQVGSKSVTLPATGGFAGNIVSQASCNGNTSGNGGDQLMYVAGYKEPCEIPAAAGLGMLKYIAHTIENSGDVPMVTTAQGNTGPNSVELGAANNPALASGAIDIWSSIVVARI